MESNKLMKIDRQSNKQKMTESPRMFFDELRKAKVKAYTEAYIKGQRAYKEVKAELERRATVLCAALQGNHFAFYISVIPIAKKYAKVQLLCRPMGKYENAVTTEYVLVRMHFELTQLAEDGFLQGFNDSARRSIGLSFGSKERPYVI